MERLGFGQRWRDIISLTWSTTTSCILLNGEPGTPIQHRRGLQQGDPLSPMLFILAMDPLQQLLQQATDQGLLTPIGASPIKMRTSLYADDAALFVRPVATDIENLQQILQHFGEATGLCTNFQKSEVFPIRCEQIDVSFVLENLQAKQGQLPCKYLGLPLHMGRLHRSDEQTIVDRVAARLPAWKARLLNKAGKLTLVKAVLSAIPTYYMTVFSLSKWAIKRIDRIRRNFLWKGSEEARGGHCLVNWRRVQRPRQLGGLGVLDLQTFNRALRIRWQWLKWKDTNKPWSEMAIQHTPTELELFRTCTTILLGNGQRAAFWHDRWLQGKSPKEIAPDLYKLA